MTDLEKIAALDRGADDFVNKPFGVGELMARLRAAGGAARGVRLQRRDIALLGFADCRGERLDRRRRPALLLHPRHVDAVLIPEPLHKDRICLGHRGVWWAEIETMGRIAHGSMPFLGECAIGTNYDITRYTKNTLFDEKIGGTVHMALGAGYPETGSTNRSAIHWDMIADLRDGGVVKVDGEPFLRDGRVVG